MSHKLTPKQVRAIYLLAGGATTIEVGRQLRMRRETLSRWKQLPWFNAEFERVMEQARGDFQHRLTHLVDQSITTMSYGLSSNFCESKRLSAALGVLKLLGIGRIVHPNDSVASPNVATSDTSAV